MADCCETFLSFFFYVILWKGNVERLNINRPYYQYLGSLRSRRVKRGVGGGGAWGVRKKRRREEKKERGSLLLFLTLHPLHPFSACHAG